MIVRRRSIWLVLATLPACGSAKSQGGPAPPAITVSPSMIALGDTPVGVVQDHPIQIANVDQAKVTVTQIVLAYSTADLTLEGVPQLPATLATGEALTVNVRHAPKNAMLAAGVIRIESNDGEHPTINVPISDVAVGAPRAAIVPDINLAETESQSGGVQTVLQAIDLGASSGAPASATVFVVNSGDGNLPLAVNGVQIAGASPRALLELTATPDPTSGPIYLPLMAPSSATAQTRWVKVRIAWTATSAMQRLDAHVVFDTGDPSTPQMDLALTAHGG
jgi:hypothetical protein